MGIRKNFVVKNGLEVAERILYVDSDIEKVGIGTIYPQYEAHVIGSIGCTDINITRNASISGILTANEIDFTGNGISIGDTTGSPGQYLRSTGSGVEWASFPTNLRSTFTYTATDLQTTFPYAYTPGFLDVYVNGVKLKGDGVTDVTEYTAVNGTQVVLTEQCFAGDFVEFIAYNPASVAAGGDGVLGFTIQEEGAIIGNDNGVTSINFIGAAVTAVGSGAGVSVYISGGSGGGLLVREEGTILGSNITSINFVGTAVTASASGAGSTIYIGSISPIAGIDTTGTSNFNNIVASGVVTATSFVRSGGTSSQFLKANGSVDSSTYLTTTGSGVNLTGIVTSITAGSGISINQSTGNVTVSASTIGVGLSTRNIASQTTGVVGIGTTTNISFSGYKSYLLMKIQTSAAAWVRIYTDTASRTSDASRSEGTDPLPGSGVIAEVITTGAETQLLSPGTIGFNNESSPTTDIYATITNKSGISTNITVNLTILQLEA
jgi:hypothetical protein